MADAPDAPVEAPVEAPKSEETPTQTTNTESTQAPDMYGFTSEQLAEMKKFYDANGGFEKVKSKISNPEKAPEASQAAPEPQNDNQPTSHTEQPSEAPRTPKGAITPSEFLAEQYFKSLAGEEKYANIAEGVRNGDYLKEMSAFGIQALNPDGSINDQKVRMYLDLKSQTVPAKPTETEPNASAAPTVTYTEVGENGIKDLDQAYKIIMEKGNPNSAKAEEFIKNSFNKK
jgi:hypothetical protein